MNKGTYNRKYYLHRQIKKSGCRLLLTNIQRTILIDPAKTEEIRHNKYVGELHNKYSYGVQLLNPMWL